MQRLHGRYAELERASVALKQAELGNGSLLFVTGEAGIGKSRFAKELAALAAGSGAKVVWGRSWEAGGAPPYWPWIQTFRALGGDPFSGSDASGDAAQQRFEVFDRACRGLQQLAAETTLVLLFDDLHVADVSSLLLLQFIAPELSGSRLLVVATARGAHSWPEGTAATALARIQREAEHIELPRLSLAEVREWVVEGTASRAEDVFRVSEGNPLFIEELLRVGVRQGTPHGALAVVLDEHLASLPAGVRSLLESAAILGRELTLDRLKQAFGWDADEASSYADKAVAAGVWIRAERGRYAFSHVLLRDRVYDSMPPSRRAELHWRAGCSAHDDSAQAAHHLLAGCSSGDAELAARAAREAAAAALAALAFDEAASMAGRGLAIAPAGSLLSCELMLLRAEGLIRTGAGAEGRKTCEVAAGLAETLQLPEVFARAALTYGTELITAGVDPTMVNLLERALAQLPGGDTPLRARLCARFAAAQVPPRDNANAEAVVALAREAIALARRLEDRETLLYTFSYGGPALGYIVPESERTGLLAEAVALARGLGQRLTQERTLGIHVLHVLLDGRRSEANVELRAFEQLMREIPHVKPWRLLALKSLLALLDERYEDARKLSDESRAQGGGAAMIAWAMQRVALAQATEPSRIAPDAETLLDTFSKIRGLLPFKAWVIAALGQMNEAAALLRPQPEPAQNFPYWMIASDVCVLTKDRELGQLAFEALSLARARNRFFCGPAGGVMFGPTARILGDLALLLERPDEAAQLYDEAITLCDAMGAKPFSAAARRGLAVCGARPRTPAPAKPRVAFSLRREGDVWALQAESGAAVRLKHGKGLSYLDQLVAQSGREVHVLVLIGAEHGDGDAGAILDARAKAEYQARLAALEDRIEVARSLGNDEALGQAREELDVLAEHLASAVGLGGRDRRAASQVERARINVQRRLKDTIDAVASSDPALGRYLAAAIKTGTFCSFSPI
jgi:AAA ATPase domain